MGGDREFEQTSPQADTGESAEPIDAEDLVVHLPIEDSLDLHTFSPKEIEPLVEEYLYQCRQRRFREIRIIHGRGTGTQRNIVRSLLAKHPHVAGFKDAPPESGGWGATMVTLKPSDPL